MRNIPERIFIVGSIGSGKTHLAGRLSKQLNLDHHNLDDFYWKKKYFLLRGIKEREKLINKAIGEKSWIIEGVYSEGVEGIVKRSNLIICLDLNPFVLIKRVMFRFLKRKSGGEIREKFKALPALIKYASIY